VDEARKPGADGPGDSLKESPPASPEFDAEEPHSQRLPRRLRHHLDANAEAWCTSGGADSPEVALLRGKLLASRRSLRRSWYVAAACLAVAVVAWWPRMTNFAHDAANGSSPLQADVERGRQQLLASGGQRVGRWAWTHESGLAAEVRGDVVWDGQRQEGYLTLAGLAPNVPAGRQYQLWIFDAARDDRYPVDGGVFDVPPDNPSLTVPIRPALRVSQPVAFAVTLEPVGGVVVSDRSHLMALARAGAN
jgi:Anti-sigma-K factor rskA